MWLYKTGEYKDPIILYDYQTRLEKSAPIIEEFIKYVDTEIKSALPRSPLGAALEYSRKLLPSFRIFLTDGSLEIDNNGAERSIKPFVIGRKNWLMCILLRELEQVQQYIA